MGSPAPKISTMPDNFKESSGGHLQTIAPATRNVNLVKLTPMFDYQKPIIRATFSGKNDLTIVQGSAGTGKTFLAVAGAIAQYKAGKVKRLKFGRPAVGAGEKLGFLPGDLKDKVDPFMRPIYDAFYKLNERELLEKGIESGDIEILTLEHLLGRDLEDSAVVIDEAQMCEFDQLMLIATRGGQGTNMTMCGDPRQIFTNNMNSTAFADFAQMIEDENIAGAQLIRIPYDAPSCRKDFVQAIQMANEKRLTRQLEARANAGHKNGQHTQANLTPEL